jgi:nicotinamide-nucleotide amidase
MSAETTLNISSAVYERAQAIIRALNAADMSIVTAESCTAGMIAAAISRADGASEVLQAGS